VRYTAKFGRVAALDGSLDRSQPHREQSLETALQLPAHPSTQRSLQLADDLQVEHLAGGFGDVHRLIAQDRRYGCVRRHRLCIGSSTP
jgi:hypothetical protein